MDNIQLELVIQVEFCQIHESSFPLWKNYLQNPSLKDQANSTNPNRYTTKKIVTKKFKFYKWLNVLPDVSPHQWAGKCPENIDPFGTFGSNYIFCGHLKAHWCGPGYVRSILSCVILQILTRFFSFYIFDKNPF